MTASKNLRSGVQLTAFQANSSANQWNGVQLPQQFIETRNGWGWVAFSRLPLGRARPSIGLSDQILHFSPRHFAPKISLELEQRAVANLANAFSG